VTERQAENCTPYNLEIGWLVKVLFTNSVLATTFLYKFDGQFAVFFNFYGTFIWPAGLLW
jgi:hypothetical protein